jgi:ribose transport system ATP-binding protein
MKLMLEMNHISKSFQAVRALHNVSLSVGYGEVHGLIGENGAGKSTLMKILSGAYDFDQGTIRFDGEEIKGISPKKMIDLGIAVIYQEMTLAASLSVAENIFMGKLPKKSFGAVNWKEIETDTVKLLEQLGLKLNPRELVRNLNVAQRQMVEIAKALSRNARLIVLDEPTAVLGDNEIKSLFKVIRQLSEKGVSFVYISHRISELFEITEHVTVLKDGEWVGTEKIENLTIDRLVTMMVGRELSDIYPKKEYHPGGIALKVTNLSRKGVLKDLNLTVRQGEIIGIAGLVGSGRTEFLRAIVGADPKDSGVIEIFGKAVSIRSPRDAISHSVGFLPEDRKIEGLFLNQPGFFNITISKLSNITKRGLINLSNEKKEANFYVNELEVRPKNVVKKVGNFSGGNQQKFMFARWLYANSKIILVDEPTRGVDVGAKREIYRLLVELTKKGVAILMVSSELPEILGMSDKILVMREGSLVGEIDRSIASEELIMQYAWTGKAIVNE